MGKAKSVTLVLLDECLGSNGFQKKGKLYFKRGSGDIVMFVHIQRSNYWRMYYLNLCVYFGDPGVVGWKGYDSAEIMTRAEVLVGEADSKRLEVLLNDEIEMPTDDRRSGMQDLVGRALSSFKGTFESLEALRRAFQDEAFRRKFLITQKVDPAIWGGGIR